MFPEEYQTYFFTVTVYFFLISQLVSHTLSRRSLFLISAKNQVNLCRDHSVIGTYSLKRGVCLTVQRIIYPFLIYENIIKLCFRVIWVDVHSFLFFF